MCSGKQIVVAAVLFLTVLGASIANTRAEEKKLIHAVFWFGCEETCQGIQDYFAEKNLDIEFVVHNAERDKSKLAGFLDQARADNADLIMTWGTSASLGIAGTLDDQGDSRFNMEIPHVFTLVADPVGVRLIESFEATNRSNLTGTFNRVPEAVNIKTIRSYLPQFKKLGLLYNANESNSLIKRDEISALAEEMDFELVALEMPLAEDGKPRPEDIPAKVAELKAQGVDFIYLGSSSFLDVNRDLFTGSAVENGLPILSPYERLVRHSQALLSISARLHDVGRLAGEQAEKILFGGRNPGDIPVARMTDFAYVVNMDVARKLNLFPPVEILQFAETVN